MNKIFIYLVIVLTSSSLFSQTYYGYVPRKPNSQVNYSEISKDFSNMLKEVSRKRAEQLRKAGFSSEREYKKYKKQLKFTRKRIKYQMKLKKKYDRGSKNVKLKKMKDGRFLYMKQ